jgi:hypothetical protein
MPLGRRINLNFSIAKERKLYVATDAEASAIFEFLNSNQEKMVFGTKGGIQLNPSSYGTETAR